MDIQSGPKLILEKGSLVLEAQEIELAGQEVIVGRDPEADLVVASPMVSRRHVRLFPSNGEYLIEDLGSTNKTFLNGRQLDGPQPLRSGDKVQLGTAIHLTFVAPAAQDATRLEVVAQTLHEASVASRGATLLAKDQPPVGLGQPPSLLVSVGGGEPESIRLTRDRVRLGRAADNDVVVSSPVVSAHHALLVQTDGGYRLKLEPGTTNPVYHNGIPVHDDLLLHDGDLLRIGSVDPGITVTLSYHWPVEAELRALTRSIDFGDQDQIQIGRDNDNDVVLDSPIVSRFHALVERIGQRFRVRDLNSANGTFVNDVAIDGDTWLSAGDTIRIGAYRFVLGEDQLNRFDETGGLRLDVLDLQKWVRKDLNLLKDISLAIEPREFLVVVGQSGGGKSTLVDAIAGYRPATHGRVLVSGIDIYRHFDAIRNEIGFVPQRDIIHTELTVYQNLDYAAQLRMPADTSREERHQRIMEVLNDLDLTERQDVQTSRLSGGQRKRVSIGVELLTKPGLFFLDEPTSGLDPGTETALMHLMRRLADQGRTIVLVTHATKNVMLADKVLFLSRGGHLAWFGPPEEALQYFDQYRSERDRRTRAMEFDEIYALLDDPTLGTAEDWAARYQESAAYQTYVVQRLAAHGHSIGQDSAPAGPAKARTKAAPVSRGKQVSGLRQLSILSSRNFKILTRDRASLLLMLAIPPLLAMLDVVLSLILGRDIFAYVDGDMENAVTTLFVPTIVAIMVGALAMMREFVKESDVYQRERLVNLKVLPYALSKFWVAGLLALYQAAAYTGIHYLAFNMPGGALEFALFYVTMLLATLAGMALGLLASAVAPNANAAPLLVILLIVPQVVLGGALIPVPPGVSSATVSRWGFEALLGITGAASDLASDTCWELPEEVRDGMSLQDKEARNCQCLGRNALDPGSCVFPGLGSFYDTALDEPEPEPPASVGGPPPEPQLPAEPQPPADSSDPQAVAQFNQETEQFKTEVARIQADYQAELLDYQAQAAAFDSEFQAYREALATWNVKRSTAVSKAEGLLGRFHENFGWAFMDKDDDRAYWSGLVAAWGVTMGMIVVLFLINVFAISRRA